MLSTLSDVLSKARSEGRGVPGLVVLGWEDALAFARAAERVNLPVILQAGPSCRAHTPLPVLGAMFTHLANTTSVPVVSHLDHSTDIEECRAAMDAGFTSVMYDGSRLSLQENISHTEKVVKLAHERGVSVEGEVGFVGYAEGEASARTTPQEARDFWQGTGVDAMAVSIGNVHLQTSAQAQIDYAALQAIEDVTDLPLVLHGSSGVPAADRARLARETSVSKFNIGTELRQVFGAALKQGINRHPERFDRIAILSEVLDPMEKAAASVLLELAGQPAE